MGFDYITIIFIAVLVIGALIGFARGSFRMLSWIAVIAAAVIVSIFFAKTVSGWVAGTDLGKNIDNGLYQFISGKIDFQVGPTHITGNTEVTKTQLDAVDAAGKVINGQDWTIWHEAYAQVSLPQFFYNLADGLINNAIAVYDGQAFAIARPITDILTSSILYAGSFATIFVAVMIVGGIIVAIIRHAIAKSGDKPGLLSRLVGMIVGFGIAGVIVWAACLTFNFLMLMDNDVSVYLKGVLHMTEGDTSWTFAKWLCSSDFGYNAIISFFIK